MRSSCPGKAGQVALFDGRSLEAWELVQCEAVIDHGNLLIQAGNGLVQTRRTYRDFILRYDWKPLKAEQWDSGVYFRYTAIPAGRSWPARYQANLRQGDEGNMAGHTNAVSHGLYRAGQWNTFELTVRGTTAAMKINGQPAWKTDGLAEPEGYIGLQAEVPGGGQCLFRNITITELQ